MDITVGRWKPEPGTKGEDLRLPGSGLYEALLNVPDWLPGVQEIDWSREVSATLPGWTVHHRRTHWCATRSALVVRFEAVEHPETVSASTVPEVSALAVPTLGVVLRAIAGLLGGWILVQVLDAIVDAIREVRKIIEISPWIAVPVGLAIAWFGVVRPAMSAGGG